MHQPKTGAGPQPTKENAKMKTKKVEVQEVGMEQIEVQYHPRKDLGEIEKLQGSIKRDGMQEPLLVYEAGEGRYAIIDGCRRYKAVQELGWKVAPCLIKKDIKPADTAHLSYVRNTEREGFNPIEIACHMKAMRDTFGFSLRDLELKGYGTPPSIASKIKLLELPEPVQSNIREGKLTIAHGLSLLKMSNQKEMERMAKRVLDFDVSAKRADMQIDTYLAKGKKRETKAVAPVPESDIPGVYIKDARNMNEQPDKSVHLVVTSPPYYVGMEFEKGMTYAEHWENINAVMDECARVLVPGGIMALNVSDINNFRGVRGNNDFTQFQLVGHKYQGFLRKHQIHLTDLIVWVKSTKAFARQVYYAYSEKMAHTDYRIVISHEPVYIFRKKGEREIPAEDVVLRSRISKAEWSEWATGVWMINRNHKSGGHPATYPEDLVRRIVRMFSYEGVTVLDPFLGSGTTVKVARELNREALGYEREPQYKAVIMEKLGIAPGEGQKQPGEGMVEFAEKALAADDYQAKALAAKKSEPEFFSNISPKAVSAILKSESQADGADEEDLKAGNQG
jgi:ParB/RepB/Spo0J family partition protein